MNLNKYFKEEPFSKKEIFKLSKKIINKKLRIPKEEDIYGYNFTLIFNSIYVVKFVYRQKADISLLNTLVSNPVGEGRAIINKFMKMPASNEKECKFNLDIATYFIEYYFNKNIGTFNKCSRFRHYVYEKSLKYEPSNNKIPKFAASKEDIEILRDFIDLPIFNKDYSVKNIDEKISMNNTDIIEEVFEATNTEEFRIEEDTQDREKENFLGMKIYDLKDTYNYLQMNGSSKYSFAKDYRKELQNHYNSTVSCISTITKIIQEKNNKIKFCIENVDIYINKGQKIDRKQIDHQWFKIDKKSFEQLNFKENDVVCIFGKIDLYKKETKDNKEVKDFKINPIKIILYQ